MLPYFLAYDLLAALYCVYTYGSIVAANGFAPGGLFGEKTWQFWVTCFFMQQQYALLVTHSGPTLSTVAQPQAIQRLNAPGLGLA